MKYIYYFLILLLIPVLTWGQNSSVGAGSASNLLLRFPASARVSGISEAYTGLANDENAMLYNPAGLPNLNNTVISLNHAEWLEDIRIDNIIYGQKLTYNMAIGFSITHMWMPSIQGKDQYGQATEDFDVSSSVVQLGLGYKIQRAFYLGIAAKYFQDKLAEYDATGFAFDLGLFMHTAIRNLTLGLSVQNLGDKVRYDKLSQEIPLIFRGGFAYQIMNRQLTLSADIVKSSDTELNLYTGIEYNFQQSFFLRLGNQYSSARSLYPSYGFGFILKQRLVTNYTFGSLEDLGMTHKVGFTFKFNNPVKSYNYSGQKPKYSYAAKTPNVQRKVFMSALENELLLSWQTIENAEYNIYVKLDSKNKWCKINKTPQKSAFERIKKPTKSGKYIFKVTCILNNQEYPISEEVIFDVK
ncbi:MAG: PorV/PorQ family protein [Calditrichaceae bacterium]|nr:PorV/PorQ family protein [Calditrichaceae bacterium]